MIGLTSRSEDESREVRGPETAITIANAPQTPKLEILAEPSLEVVREAERVELADADADADEAQRVEYVRAGQEADAEAEAAYAYAAQVAAAAPESEPLSESDPFASDPIAQVLSEQTPAPHATTLLTPDEMSIPPMGDLSARTLEPIAERFFSDGELVAAHLDGTEDEAWDTAQDRAQRKSLPHVIERRQRFSRYVRWAVGGAAIVCLAALARTTMTTGAVASGSGHTVPAPAAAAPVAKAAVAAAVAAPAAPTAEAKVEAPKVAVSQAAEPALAEAALAEAPKAEAPKAEDAKPAVAVAPAPGGDKTALEEKKDARRALERGKLAEAIEAGERSVALDPLDGEAWLLLGAAYQDKGKMAEARRCYTACVKEGKRGPIGECRAMLH